MWKNAVVKKGVAEECCGGKEVVELRCAVEECSAVAERRLWKYAVVKKVVVEE